MKWYIFSRKKCFPVKKYFAGEAGAPARPSTSGDIFAPINLGVDRSVAHFCEIIYRKTWEMSSPSNVEKSRRTTASVADTEKQAQAADSLAPKKRAPKLGKLKKKDALEGKIQYPCSVNNMIFRRDLHVYRCRRRQQLHVWKRKRNWSQPGWRRLHAC